MPLIYGEGKEYAIERLREIINKYSKSKQIIPSNIYPSVDNLSAKCQVKIRFGPTLSLTVRY